MPMGMTVTAPNAEIIGAALRNFASAARTNSIFLANLISSFASHERCIVHLYRAAAGMTQFPKWRERYEEFLAQTEDHIRILYDVISQLGGDPQYVSPQARMNEFVNTKLMEPILLDGSVDNLTRELTMLEAVSLAESKCHANWELLKRLAEQMPESSAKQAVSHAVERVEDQEDAHVQWARNAWQQAILAQLTATG
jgi:rubrerythrin